MITYAFAYRGDPGRVVLWCKDRGGKVPSYFVINGHWVLWPDQEPFDLLWRGEVPEKHAGHYNDAIAWIQEQVDASDVVTVR